MTATYDREYVNDMLGENKVECENCLRWTDDYVPLDFGPQGVWTVCTECLESWRNAA